MRLEVMTPAHVRRAVAIYLEQAFPEGCGVEPKVRLSDLERASTLEELLQHFQTPRRDAAPGLRHYALRLGNWRYAFMKFVVQEYLVDEEFFFTVDTHDDLEVKPGAPDYERGLELKVQNRELKERVE